MTDKRNQASLRRRAGFTLPAILVVVGALLILAVGVILIVGIERQTSRAFSDRERANLAARAGLEDIRGILNQEAANDDFIVLQSTLASAITPDTRRAPHLFIARGSSAGSSYSYRYVPLFSSKNRPTTTSTLAGPALEPLVGTSKDVTNAQFTTLPYNDKVRASWLTVQDAKGRAVARYSYWVEDLQSRLDPGIVGNDKGSGKSHVRAAWPFAAAGLSDDPSPDVAGLDQIALYAINPAATSQNQEEVGKALIGNRKVLVSPDSLLAAAGFKAPITRLLTGDPATTGLKGEIADPKGRAIEQGLASGLRSYKEQPLVPFSPGIDGSVAGKPKLNLNKLVATGGSSAVNDMADFILDALPNFEERKGGFPDNYVKTLAANAIDYADGDNSATADGSTYRGIDAYPVVSEFLMRFRWENVITKNGRKLVVLRVATFVELWNTSNLLVNGRAEVTHDTRYSFPLGANPEVSLADHSQILQPSPLIENDGSSWFPSFSVSLNPNEYRVFRCGEVTYEIDAGPSSFFVPSPILLQGETYGSSGAGYRFRWNGQLVDRARGGLHRNDCSLKYPATERQAVRTTIPSHSHTQGAGAFLNNMGDPRMSFYNTSAQDANSYPSNYSPNRRNIRWGTVYSGDGATKLKVYGRVMPSEWPDGGHNSTCESQNGINQTNTQLEPDAAVFQVASNSVLRNPAVDESVTRLSLDQRFYSATELGRVYDPIMWNVAVPSGANLPWGDVLTGTASDSRFGGGNTLRIGRPEHPRFNQVGSPGREAYRLLDLFHAGISRSTSASEREGAVVEIKGHVNLNTASRDALRAIAIGELTMDPKMAIRNSESHSVSGLMAPPTSLYKMPSQEVKLEAERIADAIILARNITPFSSASGIAELTDLSNRPLFGNKSLIADGSRIHRTDSAAEEVFARVYEASTVRSRNFRIWIVGQAIAPTTSSTVEPEVLSEVRKAYTVFLDPGQRTADGKINPVNSRLKILHENDF